MDRFVLAQIAGVVAVIFSLLMYQFNTRRTMLILDLCGNVFWALTFLQLGAPTGLSMVVIGVFSNIIFIVKKPNKKNRWLLGLILSTILVATLATWAGPMSLLAMSGSMLFTIRFWTTKTKTIRRLSLTAPPFWFAYDLLTANYPGMFIEVFGVASNLVAQYRFDFAAKQKSSEQ